MIWLDLITIKKGGGVRIAKEFLYYLDNNLDKLEQNVTVLVNKDFHYRTVHLKYITVQNVFFLQRKMRLNNYNKNEDIVFTLFGPNLFNLYCDIMGLAWGWMYYKEWDAWATLNRKEYLFKSLKKFWFTLYTANIPKVVILEAEWSRKELLKKAIFRHTKFEVITNGVDLSPQKRKISKKKGRRKLIYVTSYYPHKNFNFIKSIAHFADFDIFVTLDDISYDTLDFPKNVINLGYLDNSGLSQAYSRMDGVLHPSLIETFSAGYLEAVYFNLPIFCPRRRYTQEILGDYADYVPVENVKKSLAIINERLSLGHDKSHVRQELMKSYPPSAFRYNEFIRVLNNL